MGEHLIHGKFRKVLFSIQFRSKNKCKKKKYFKNREYDLLTSFSRVYKARQCSKHYISTLISGCERQMFREYSQAY